MALQTLTVCKLLTKSIAFHTMEIGRHKVYNCIIEMQPSYLSMSSLETDSIQLIGKTASCIV